MFLLFLPSVTLLASRRSSRRYRGELGVRGKPLSENVWRTLGCCRIFPLFRQTLARKAAFYIRGGDKAIANYRGEFRLEAESIAGSCRA